MEGGESQGRAAPGDPELLKKADISLMYFTEAEQEYERERERENYIKWSGRRSTRGQRNLGNDYGASRFRGELKTVGAYRNRFKKEQKFIGHEFPVT